MHLQQIPIYSNDKRALATSDLGGYTVYAYYGLYDHHAAGVAIHARI
jgi:hypothetical protein